MRRPRVVVCGTGFGRIYLAGLGAADSPFELAGILARGSERSQACARRWGVPVYESPEQLPSDLDAACVVVSSAINGGPGAQLAMSLMARGLHVLQEHPLHAEELAACLRTARDHGVRYRVNTHHVHVAPVRRFVTATRVLTRLAPPLFVDAVCSFQVLYTLFDILGEALGKLRPWRFEHLPGAPFRSLSGVFAGVPTTLRIQHQMDPSEPDNHGHLWHRITIGTEGGNLMLVSSAGPVLWCTRPHLPRTTAEQTGFDQLSEPYLRFASAVAIGPGDAPSWADVLTRLWPQAVRTALGQLWDGDPLAKGQYHLALCQLTREVAGQLGPVELVRRQAPHILAVEDIVKAASEQEREVLG